MTKKRKCCGTPRGSGPHSPACPQRTSEPLSKRFDRDGVTKAARMDLLNDVAGDMPDGAYFAMAEEFGIDIEDFIDE